MAGGRIPFDEIGNCATVNHQPLGHLQRNGLYPVSPDMMDRLVNLKVVVRR